MISNESELDFFRLNERMIHHPACFHFNGKSYTPDFYDPETNTYFEIIGSRQRFNEMKKEGKIDEFRKCCPKIRLIICKKDRTEYQKGKDHSKRLPYEVFEKILLISQKRGMRPTNFAHFCGINPAVISQLTKRKRNFTEYYSEIFLSHLCLTKEQFFIENRC